MTPIESFCASCPHIGDCDISGSTRAMKCTYVVRVNKPIPETLFELQCIQQWGEKFGWASVEGLVKTRIEIYEKVGKKTTIGTLRG